ncbi:branched-chain amino acid ABC transporter permease [Ferviditalea candida]|uniref:Branched-chain amino acid ABC transporter permease n=1 Tax=Ferviditalea candida TaxID=3108399 RepID=A0ABU5ZIH0_9BACL|nr:branched-chain amino acid ABC transporter permease [Paenibacillaceae bacterium T2]
MLNEILNPYYLQVASFILINIMLGISIYITLATGQVSLGNAGFMSIGAYTSAILTTTFHVPLVVGIIAGTLVAFIAGILVGIPTLRLSGVFLAIVTLGFGEVIRVLFVNWESVTKGAVGIAGIPPIGVMLLQSLKSIGFDPAAMGMQNNQFGQLSVFLILLLINIALIWFFVRQNHSRIGRAFAAIKMDERAAEAMGINITYYKVLAFAQGAMISGFAGTLFAHVVTYISPADFSYHRAVEILIFAVFGGSNVIWGPVFGATFLTTMPEFLRFMSEYRYMIYGLILIAMMAFRPQGLIDAQLIHRLGRSKSKEESRYGSGT